MSRYSQHLTSVKEVSSCHYDIFFSDTKYSIALGAGIPALMYILQMLANAGDKADGIKYFTFFTLFDASGIVAGTNSAVVGMLILLIGAVVLYAAGICVFCKKDLHI